jgi:hypothetical protein
MIILNATQADAIRGITTPGHSLEPVPLADGATYVLPESVLADPAHAIHHDLLASLPTRDVAEDEYPRSIGYP